MPPIIPAPPAAPAAAAPPTVEAVLPRAIPAFASPAVSILPVVPRTISVPAAVVGAVITKPLPMPLAAAVPAPAAAGNAN